MKPKSNHLLMHGEGYELSRLRDCVVQQSYLPSGLNILYTNCVILYCKVIMPAGTKCIMCEEFASLRCCYCGPLVFFCEECFKKKHSIMNIFHVPEVWKV